MITEQELRGINTHLALIEAELGRIRVAIREASGTLPDGIIGNSSDSPYAQQPDPKQDLFNLLSDEFGVIALESDMREIIDAVRKVLNNPKDNPYQVDWANAPDWADVHAFDEDDKGFWYGANSSLYKKEWGYDYGRSNFTLPDGLDWKLSKTTRPC